MSRARIVRVSPGQLTLALIHEHPDALRIVATGTGRPVALLPGGALPAPTPLRMRKAA